MIALQLKLKEFGARQEEDCDNGTPFDRSLDDEVVHAVSASDLEAVAIRCDSRLRAVARRYLKCESDSEDAVQDAFLLALKRLDGFRGECRLETWLHRIVVNVCLMKLRSTSHRSVRSLDSVDASQLTANDAESPQSYDMQFHLRKTINELPENQRAIIQLRYFEGFSTSQTAELLGSTTSAVKTRLHRLRTVLRGKLSDKRVNPKNARN